MGPPPLFSKRWARNAKQQFAKGLGDTGKFLKSASGVAKGIYNAADETGLLGFVPGANLVGKAIDAVGSVGKIASTTASTLADAGDNPAANASAVFQGVRQGLDLYNSMG
jgi:hypothetical protein